MSNFSCIVIGGESLLIGCADAILDRGNTIRAVVSGDRDILDWAVARGLPVLQDIAALKGQFEPGDFDWLFSIANLAMIPDAVLALPARGAINFHDGPLPRFAGLNAPVWALMAGEKEYGVTWHMLTGGVDEGDIVEQALFEIGEGETAFSLNSKCYGAAMDSFGAVLGQLETGALQPTAQDLSQRSYFARDARPSAAGRLDFTKTAKVLSAEIRALDFGGYWNPLLCPKLEVAGQVVLVGAAEMADEPANDSADAPAGSVISCDRSGMTVATGDGALRLSGLTGTDGKPLDPTSLATPGQILATPDAAMIAKLDACIQKTLKGEPHWRKALQELLAVSVPLAMQTDKPADWTSYDITLPEGLSDAAAVTTVMAWALRGNGGDMVDLAFCDAAMADAARATPGYVSQWVPLRIQADNSLTQAIRQTEQELARIARIGGFAPDLMARDPRITNTTMPDVAITTGPSVPMDGTCITVAVTGKSAITLHFDRAQLNDDATALLINRLETLAQAATGQDAQILTIAELPILPAGERTQTVTHWNRSARDYDRSQTIHHAFEIQAARTPDATALVFEDRELSYSALNARANAVAAQLRAKGVKPGSHVGLYVQRSPELLIGALAILKAGGAYVPLDPAYPADRIAHYLSDSAASVVITQAELRNSLPPSKAQLVMITDADAKASTGTGNVDGGATADDLAYLIYTSGSTGTPKGVMVEHRNVANFFAGMDDRIDHAKGGVWLAVTSLSFDISVLELFWTLARGFKVVLTSDENRAVVSNGPIPVSDRKIDLNLMFWGNDDGPGPKKYELLLEGAKFADAHGFNAIWTPERHFHAFGGPYPNPAVTGAAVAAVTKNISVRAGSCVAPLHHPARIAEDWAIIDNLTNGRAGLGIAAGWQPHDFVLRPENTPPNNKPAMYEAIETLRRLWRGEAVEFPKQDGEMHAVVTQPRPVSKELPIWVTTAGNPDTWREAGEIGANVLTHLLGQSIDEVADKIKIYHAALRKAGHDPDDFTVTVMLHTYIAETREAAANIARGPMKQYMASAAGLIKQFAWVFPAFKRPVGVDNAFDMSLDGLGEDELDAILEFAFERYFNDSGLFGTVEDGLARAEQLKRIGVDEIACLIDYGIAPRQVMEGLKPLAQVLARTNVPSELAEDDYSIAAQIIRHDVTHLQCTPSMARIISMNDEARQAMGRIKHLMLGGEALAGDLVADLSRCTRAVIANMYGPTETTIWSTTQTVTGQEPGIAPIGTPIANTSVYVLDSFGQPAPVGVPGELFIGGEGVTRGYWQRPALTDERFVPDPFAAEANLTVTAAPRMYRTGDLVRWRSDGTLGFMGRSDHQVKIRGQRIELGEIETALGRHASVTGSVVITREIADDTRLLAYVTTSDTVTEAALKTYLAAALPESMVPAHIVMLDAMPLTPNKKIDRAALPDPSTQRRQDAGEPATEPGVGFETSIAAIWSHILGVTDIRSDDNFFALGGHSLLAVQAHREIREKLELPKLSITDIFRFPTLSGLAAHLGDGTAPAAPATPVVDAGERSSTMSKRRAMRAGRRTKAE